MNYDDIADNEDQIVRDIWEEEQREKNRSINSGGKGSGNDFRRRQNSRNNFDDEDPAD